MSTYVIAECGSSHDGSLERAIELVHVAAQSGADAAKFQYWSDPFELAQRRNAPELGEMYAKYRVGADWLPAIAAACQGMNIEFACTVFLPHDVYLLAHYAKVLKVASFEAQAEDLLAALVPLGIQKRRIIISLGMGCNGMAAERYLHEPVKTALEEDSVVVRAGERIVWAPEYLWCVSSYPAPVDELQLARLWRIPRYDKRPLYDGFSDHSPAHEMHSGALAVAAGAGIIERHLRLADTSSDNPDYPHSMEPHYFGIYVERIRHADILLGSRDDAPPQPCEADCLRYRVGVLPPEETT